MDWNDIKLLVLIERTGSFAGAAAALNVNSATVSRRVSSLEHVAGARLFRRMPTGAVLTASGAQLLRQALRVEGEVKDFERVLRTVNQHAPRLVSIQASEGVITYLLAPLIARQNWGPLGTVARQINLDLPPIRTVTLEAEEPVDIRILWSSPEHFPPARPTDRIRKVASVKFVPFVSENYSRGQALSEPRRFEDLAHHPLLTLDQYAWFQTEQSMRPWHDLTVGQQRGLTSAKDSAVLGLMTVNGGGISLLPTYSVMYSGLLKPLDVAVPEMRADLWLVAGEEDLKDPVVRGCYDMLGRIFTAFEW